MKKSSTIKVRLFKSGGSLVLSVPKGVVDLLELTAGESLEVEFSKEFN